jgi:hypothetical protein
LLSAAGSTPAVLPQYPKSSPAVSLRLIGFANTNIHLSGVCFRIYKKGEKTMNVFKKYCPNVWVAECNEKHHFF